MNLVGSSRKPEYIFRPSQILRRLARECSTTPGRFADVKLPWGLTIRVRPGETIGSCIWRVGVYDLCLSECIWRLLDPGERAVDVGANIGYMTGLMAVRTGPRGMVYAFEPHPEVFQDLIHNLEKWQELEPIAFCRTYEMALGDEKGTALLDVPDGFESNRGTSALRDCHEVPKNIDRAIPVRVERLDNILADVGSIGVLKIDVEGRELSVLDGAKRLFEREAVRDVLFEEHNSVPSATTVWLEAHGYHIFCLDQLLLRVNAVPIHFNYRVRGRKDAPNLLATLEPKRASERLALRGWRVLKAKGRMRQRK